MALDPYRAQRLLPFWDQRRLQRASALVIGVGGLGTPAALYLSAMGIGRLILCDPDTIALENLHRQPLYTSQNLGQPKVHILAHHLQNLRPDLSIEIHQCWADETFLRTIGASAHIWIDGTDNLPSRLLIDEIAHQLGKPWVYGAIYQWEGQVILWDGLRYRDYFGEGTEGPSCNEAGVLGAIPGIIGSWQAALSAMYLAAPEIAPRHRLFRISLLTGEAESFELFSSTAPAHPASANVPSDYPLEISLETMGNPAAYYWIDIREEAHPPFFYLTSTGPGIHTISGICPRTGLSCWSVKRAPKVARSLMLFGGNSAVQTYIVFVVVSESSCRVSPDYPSLL
jgi:molybdopterin/thiamine biosynthesis adenylyltransferase